MASSCKRTGSLSGPSFFRPVFQDLDIPQIASLAEEFPPSLPHFPQDRSGSTSSITAATERHRQRHAQVVHRVRLRRRAHLFQFLQGALHPIAQARCSEFEPAIVLPVPIFSQAGPNRGGPRPLGARSYRLALCRSRVQ